MRSLIILLLLSACVSEPQRPCAVESENKQIMDTALKAYLISQGYGWTEGGCN